jgi:hypothetical protein
MGKLTVLVGSLGTHFFLESSRASSIHRVTVAVVMLVVVRRRYTATMGLITNKRPLVPFLGICLSRGLVTSTLPILVNFA